VQGRQDEARGQYARLVIGGRWLRARSRTSSAPDDRTRTYAHTSIHDSPQAQLRAHDSYDRRVRTVTSPNQSSANREPTRRRPTAACSPLHLHVRACAAAFGSAKGRRSCESVRRAQRARVLDHAMVGSQNARWRTGNAELSPQLPTPPCALAVRELARRPVRAFSVAHRSTWHPLRGAPDYQKCQNANFRWVAE
jgi:hypothetical protein